MKAALLYSLPKTIEAHDARLIAYAEKVQATLAVLRKQFTIVKPANADVLIVVSGDGPMTKFVKKFTVDLPGKKFFYGINRGTLGFLLNDHTDDDDFVAAINEAEWVEFPMLVAQIYFQNGKQTDALAFNDVYTKTATSQSAKHRIFIDGVDILGANGHGQPRYFQGDGIIVCTPGGSTAYNRAAGGNILDHKATSLGLTPVSCFSPIGFKPQILESDAQVTIEMIEDAKRKHIVIADNTTHRRVARVVIYKSCLPTTLGFRPNNSYFHKTLALRFPWMS